VGFQAETFDLATGKVSIATLRLPSLRSVVPAFAAS
jgi:hypothetical protein